MATQSNSVPGTGWGSPYVDSLVWGCAWVGAPVTYWFGSGPVAAQDSAIGAFTGAAWSQTEMDAFAQALAQYSAVCGLQFEQASDAESANVVWWLAPQSALGFGVLGMHDVPDGSNAQAFGYFNRQHSTWSSLAPGSFGYVTVIHELGHGVGLAHPHDGGDHDDATRFPGVASASSTGTGGVNQGIWTTMSYNDGWNLADPPGYGWGYQASPMALDIAALQAIYGPNMATRTGSDTYQLPTLNASGTGFTCIWDAGGAADTISNAGASLPAVINLNPATLTGSNAGGFVSRASGIYGGFTIAANVTIENATGGRAGDTLVGNPADNVLDGAQGNDTMAGGAGNDTYHQDSARDVVTEATGGGSDTVVASVGVTLRANVENLVLTGTAALAGKGNGAANLLLGNSGNNNLQGDGGNDTLGGGGGVDMLSGGRGADLFRFEQLDAGAGALRDTVKDFRGGDGDRLDLAGIDANVLAEGDQAFTFIGVAAFTGGAGELRFASGMLQGDVNGDGTADVEILLPGVRGSFLETWIASA